MEKRFKLDNSRSDLNVEGNEKKIAIAFMISLEEAEAKFLSEKKIFSWWSKVLKNG